MDSQIPVIILASIFLLLLKVSPGSCSKTPVNVIPGTTPSQGGPPDPHKVLTSWADLAEVGISKDYVNRLFERDFGGEKPKSLHLNEGICVQYGHYCYNTPGNVTYKNAKIEIKDKIADKKNISDDAKVPIEVTVKLSTKESKSATLTVTQESSLMFSNTITIQSLELGISDKFTASFTIKNTVGSSQTSSSEIIVEDSVKVDLKANSSVVAELKVKWTQLTEDFEMPIAINGWIGADFGKSVNGHYYWFMQLPARNSTLRGNVLCAYDIEGDIVVTDTERASNKRG